MRKSLKGIACLLSALILVSSLSCVAFSAETYLEYKGYVYARTSFTDKTISIHQYTGNSETINIAEDLKDIGWTVTSIEDNAFVDHSEIKEAVIPDTVTSIGSSAFSGCTSLQKIILPENLTSISVGSFRNCSSATEIIIPSKITEIPSFSFFGCSKVEQITIPSTVKKISPYAFYGCTELKRLFVPASVTSMDMDAFKNISNLTIYGNYNSYAQSFAKDNNIPFVAVDEYYVKLGEAVNTIGAVLNVTSVKYTKISRNNLQAHYLKSYGVYNQPFSESTDYKTEFIDLETALVNLRVITQIPLGDANGDGKINLKDAVVVQRYANDSAELDFEHLQYADVNNDGAVNVKDGSLIQQYASDIIHEFPI